MKKQITYFIYLALVMLCSYLLSCAKEITPRQEVTGTVVMSLTLDVQDDDSWGETKSDDTQLIKNYRSSTMDISMCSNSWSTPQTKAGGSIPSTDAERKINKVYILQYDKDNNSDNSLIYSKGDIIPDETGQIRYVELKACTNYNLYVLANYGSAPFGVDENGNPKPAPENIIKFMECESHTDLGETQPRADNLPMYGELLNQNTSKIPTTVVPMNRLVSKVIYDITNNFTSAEDEGATWALSKCSIVDAPKRVSWWGYRNFKIRPSYGKPLDFTTYTLDKKLKGSCYILENMRAENDDAYSVEKKVYKGASAAFLNIEGKESKTNGITTPLNYSFYLGKDLLSNFDVERNKAYTLTATIKTRDFSDSRCNIDYLYIGKFAGWDDTKKAYTQSLFIDRFGNNSSGPNDGISSTKEYKAYWYNAEKATGQNNIYDGWYNTYDERTNSPDFAPMWYCRGKNGDATAIQNQGKGWFLPSQNQAMALWIVAYPAIKYSKGEDAYTFNGFDELRPYWSSTEGLVNKSGAWDIYVSATDKYNGPDPNVGMARLASKPNSGEKNVRCVFGI